jgi:hypothetical protein
LTNAQSSGWGEQPPTSAQSSGWGEQISEDVQIPGWGVDPPITDHIKLEPGTAEFGKCEDVPLWGKGVSIEEGMDPRLKRRKIITPEEKPRPLDQLSDPNSTEASLEDCYEFRVAELFSNQRDTYRIESGSSDASSRLVSRRLRASTSFNFSSLNARR